MSLISISQLGKFAGLKPHTIRAWEARYNAVKPARSLGNTRYYDTSQMRRLLNIVSLVNAGYKVSEVAKLPDEKIHLMLEAVYDNRRNESDEYFISQLIGAGMTYDEARFEKIFSHCLARYRLKNTYEHILLPMLERIGQMWRCDKSSPSQEHFVTNLLRRKLFTAVDALPPPHPQADKWLLFLPENEWHELGLLLAYNLIRLSGEHVVYLGANVPFTSLITAIGEIRPHRLLLFSVHQEISRPTAAFLQEMERSFTGKHIYVAGNSPKGPDAAKYQKVVWLRTVEDLTSLFNIRELSRLAIG